MALSLLFASQAYATCSEPWPKDMPDFTCVPFTDKLLVSLQGATKAQVTKAMKAIGRPLGPIVHFVSRDDNYPGGVDLEFKDDHVVLISGRVDLPGSEKRMSFRWTPAYQGPASMPCSDLPGSHYARCSK
jgi:hypothetical protein